jgi:3-methyladenine DNA glycosylase AlkD
MKCEEVIKKLESLANPKNVEGMARYGINPKNNLGIGIYKLRPLAKEIGINHELSLQLWETGIHDARLLAVFIANPSQLTEEQMDSWANDFDSWDVCDQACTSLFDLTTHAYKKVFEWAEDDREFVKRAAFSIIAGLAVHDKKANDERFDQFFELIIRESTDDRNYVRKAINWALRNIGKRNKNLNKKAIKTAEKIKKIDDKTARWIANDAIRELKSEKVKQKLERIKN